MSYTTPQKVCTGKIKEITGDDDKPACRLAAKTLYRSDHSGPVQGAIWSLHTVCQVNGRPAGHATRGGLQPRDKGHPRPARLLSARRFGKAGARALAAMARSLSPRSTKGETAASPPYGSFLHFWDLGSDMRGLKATQGDDRLFVHFYHLYRFANAHSLFSNEIICSATPSLPGKPLTALYECLDCSRLQQLYLPAPASCGPVTPPPHHGHHPPLRSQGARPLRQAAPQPSI